MPGLWKRLCLPLALLPCGPTDSPSGPRRCVCPPLLVCTWQSASQSRSPGEPGAQPVLSPQHSSLPGRTVHPGATTVLSGHGQGAQCGQAPWGVCRCAESEVGVGEPRDSGLTGTRFPSGFLLRADDLFSFSKDFSALQTVESGAAPCTGHTHLCTHAFAQDLRVTRSVP